MVFDYDKLYASEADALGPPTAEFVTFFTQLGSSSLEILDIGCGQGRDAIFLGRMGHRVHGVDLSAHGVSAVNAVAEAEGLPITAEVCDLLNFQTNDRFDVLLCDRTLHMLGPNEQTRLLGDLLSSVTPGGLVLIADEKRNLPRFRAVFEADQRAWSTLKDMRGYLFMRHDQLS